MEASELLYDSKMKHWGAVVGPLNVFVLEKESDPAVWFLHIDHPTEQWEQAILVNRSHFDPKCCSKLNQYLRNLETMFCEAGA